MGATETLLIIIIILLVFVAMKRDDNDTSTPIILDCVDKKSGGRTQVKISGHVPNCECMKCVSPEAASTAGNMEHYSNMGHEEGYEGMTGGCGSFNGSELSYNDFVTAISVDPQTIDNHGSFVSDRLQTQNQNITGRTYAMGEIEGNSSNWIGIRGRPQMIPEASQGNPTQIPDDVRETDFTKNPRFTWDSAPY